LAVLHSQREKLIAQLGVVGDPCILKVPGVKSIQAEAREQESLSTEMREIEGRLMSLRDDLTEEETSLDHLASQAAIYSQADLSKSREERDAIWAEILKSQSIDESLTGAISHADEVSDALHDHADHIATAAGHQVKITQLKNRQKNLRTDLKRAQKALDDWQAAWEPESQGMSPIALLEWREEWEKLCQLIREEESLDLRLRSLREKEEELLADLGGQDFAKVHRELKMALNLANQEQGERNLIQKQVSKNEVKEQQFMQEAKSLKKDLAEAKKVWAGVCEDTQISPDLPPKAAVESLNERARVHEISRDLEARKTAVEVYQELLKTLAKRFKVDASEPALTFQKPSWRTRVMSQRWELWPSKQEQKILSQSFISLRFGIH